MITTENLVHRMQSGFPLCDGEVLLDLDGYKIGIQSNCEDLLEKLGIYFAHTLGHGTPDIVIKAIQRPQDTYGLAFTDWKREPGKTGRKDAYVDIENARIIQKVRTGMIFLQSQTERIAAGPCLENDNQVINFINAQYMNHLQQNGALICHASGLCAREKGLGIAGFSGGGKSTLMLHLLSTDNVQYLTNDRLFLQDDLAIGIPKLPRVNPGTMLHDPNLIDLLPTDRVDALKALPPSELWDLEEKYDVFVEDIYGPNKIIDHAPLNAFLILNWKRESEAPCKIQEIKIEEHIDLLKAVMKSPGPFYQDANAHFISEDMHQDNLAYLNALKNVRTFEASGKIDFPYAKDFCLQYLLIE
ncbi:MAG: HprK-related kinase B [Terasakiella sp.]|uniref:HprK-related kinase B n=1 Tax=unclassified Terasakiella TaxID=2614952 RepID=UPI003B00A847